MKIPSPHKKPERFGTPLPRHSAYARDKSDNCYSQWRWAAGVASEFIYHLSELIARHGSLRVVLYVRVSSQRQAANGKLLRKVTCLRNKVLAMGCEIVGEFYEISHSSVHFVDDNEEKGYTRNRWQFDLAIECAREHGAVLVAAERDRFVRGRHLDNATKRHEKPSVGDYVRLQWLTTGVTLATLTDPNKSGRSPQTKDGLEATDKKLGRPAKLTLDPGFIKRRREALLPEVLNLHAKGCSCRRVANRLNATPTGWPPLAYKTVFNWVKARNQNKPKKETIP